MALKKLHGVHVPHLKNTADMAAVAMDCPSTVTIPMSMHIGAPAKPLVKVGETVTVGQRILISKLMKNVVIYSCQNVV